MTLGSKRVGKLNLFLGSGARLAVAGCALGVAGMLAALRLVRGFLFGVSPFDPLVLALAASVICLLALSISLVPAWRASSIDPMQALRGE